MENTMNESLILVSRKSIVIHIFTLVCKKLNIDLEVLSEVQVDHKVDIIVIDNDFIDDRFNILKSYTKRMGAISKEELPFGSANDFIIPLPFLPSSLEQVLRTQLDILEKRKNTKTYISNVELDIDEDFKDSDKKENFENEPAVEYLEELASEIGEEMNAKQQDESLIKPNSLPKGGILDEKEISNIQEVMSASTKEFSSENNEDIQSQWADLSTIIDEAIDEVSSVSKVYSKFEKNPITVLLNNYDLEELTPLLNKLDQDIIDSLTDGYEIHLQVKLAQVQNNHE